VRTTTDPVAGLVTERDVITVLAEHVEDPPIREVMTSPVPTTTPAERVSTAAALLREADVDVLPVLECEQTVGLLTSDVVDGVPAGLAVKWDGSPVTLPPDEPAGPTTATAALSAFADQNGE
jgi:predicted transcriptional regulator